MTIKEIKEWREDNLKFDRGIDTADIKFEIIDTLLAEVDQWKNEYQKVNVVRNEQDTKLTIATEALERLRILTDNCTQEPLMNTIIDTALERIKE